jgi:dynein light chain Tctex-type 1
MWINEINEMIMEKLVSIQKPFKYLVNCLIMQRKGASVVVSQSNSWDTGLDSCFTLIWPK